jgi:hypothetical protein
MTGVLSAANEIAVELFLEERWSEFSKFLMSLYIDGV